MADYKRLVSYIYAYPGGVRDKNVGFAKAEVRNGQFKLTVSVKGVYTDTPELFGVYVMVDGKKHQPGGFTLLKTGTVMINQGIGQYQDLFNPMNINQSGYTFEDISGIALARENEDFYRMFSLWEDCILNTEDITFAQPEAAAASNPVAQADSEEVSVKEQVNRTTGQEAERKSAEMSGNVRESETVRRNAEDVSENEVEEAAVTSKPATPESAQSAGQQGGFATGNGTDEGTAGTRHGSGAGVIVPEYKSARHNATKYKTARHNAAKCKATRGNAGI